MTTWPSLWPTTTSRAPCVTSGRATRSARSYTSTSSNGAIVKPDSIILELSDLQLQRDALDAEYQLRGAEADYANLKVQVNSELMNQKAAEAALRSDYEQARIQHEVDEKLHAEGIGADVTAKLSKVKEDQLAIRLQLESDILRVPHPANSR